MQGKPSAAISYLMALAVVVFILSIILFWVGISDASQPNDKAMSGNVSMSTQRMRSLKLLANTTLLVSSRTKSFDLFRFNKP
jgi:uncharacterized protein (UPF0333 family)